MAKGGRPSKYNWQSIREAYEKGFDKDEIVKKFRVPKAVLTNKINKEKWEVLCDVKSDIYELNATSHKIAQNYTQNPDIAEMFEERIVTLTQDNELIGNNRKILKAFQGLIGQGIKNNMYKNPQDIKAGVSSIKDIEAVANPQANKQEINVNTQNNLQQVNYESDYLNKIQRTALDSD